MMSYCEEHGTKLQMDDVYCDICDGDGQKEVDEGTWVKCGWCDGIGVVEEEYCVMCKDEEEQ